CAREGNWDFDYW
nr:immunoglobulin heavy chain junction region [Mus musculus]